MTQQQSFEQRAGEAIASLPVLGSEYFSFQDIQHYVRLWDPGHCLFSFQPGDTLLECAYRVRAPGWKMIISPVQWHPTLVKCVIGQHQEMASGYLLPENLTKLHKFMLAMPHQDGQYVTVAQWKSYAEKGSIKRV